MTSFSNISGAAAGDILRGVGVSGKYLSDDSVREILVRIRRRREPSPDGRRAQIPEQQMEAVLLRAEVDVPRRGDHIEVGPDVYEVAGASAEDDGYFVTVPIRKLKRA